MWGCVMYSCTVGVLCRIRSEGYRDREQSCMLLSVSSAVFLTLLKTLHYLHMNAAFPFDTSCFGLLSSVICCNLQLQKVLFSLDTFTGVELQRCGHLDQRFLDADLHWGLKTWIQVRSRLLDDYSFCSYSIINLSPCHREKKEDLAFCMCV